MAVQLGSLKREDAVRFLASVKARLAGRPHDYNTFINIMKVPNILVPFHEIAPLEAAMAGSQNETTQCTMSFWEHPP